MGGSARIDDAVRPARLTAAEREEVSRGLATGESLRHIAATLHRSPSTVSREVARNGGRDAYRAQVAEAAAWDRARRPKTCKLAADPLLRLLVQDKLDLRWSPEQIASSDATIRTVGDKAVLKAH